MDNKEIAKLFNQYADLLELDGANTFKIRAMQRAVQIIENLPQPVKTLYDTKELAKVDGIGKGIVEKIGGILATGKLDELDEIKQKYPDGLLDMMDVPGLGPKKVKLIYDELKISNIDELKQAAENGKLADLPGMGKKSEEKILKGIATKQSSVGRYPIGLAYPIAKEIHDRLAAMKGVYESSIAGSMRRGKETVGDVDILISAKDVEPLMNEFLATNEIEEVIANGKTKSSIRLKNGLQVDLRIVPKESFGAALQYFTGSKEHNVRVREIAVKQGLKVNEYGVYKTDSDELVAGETEEDVYQSLGLAWVPPELREGLEEIEWAQKNELPELITEKDLICALHNHTTASDGKMSMEELAKEGMKRGFKVIAVTDHSVSSAIAGGLSADRLRRQIDEVRELNEKLNGVTLLAGSEVDIKADGSLDYDDDLLAALDIVVASVHMSQDQPRDKVTKRVCRALENPHVTILGHPSGRLINKRPPMDIDFEQVFATAKEHNKVMEINCHYLRLDLHDRHIREAANYGLQFSINTDTHQILNFDNLRYGVQTARRGRLTKEQVINTLPWAKLKKILKK
jgi:DNA polymerase (family 10)